MPSTLSVLKHGINYWKVCISSMLLICYIGSQMLSNYWVRQTELWIRGVFSKENFPFTHLPGSSPPALSPLSLNQQTWAMWEVVCIIKYLRLWFDSVLNFHPTQLFLSKSFTNKHKFSLGIRLHMEQEEPMTAKNHLNKERKRGTSTLCWKENGFQTLGREFPTLILCLWSPGSIRTRYYL